MPYYVVLCATPLHSTPVHFTPLYHMCRTRLDWTGLGYEDETVLPDPRPSRRPGKVQVHIC